MAARNTTDSRRRAFRSQTRDNDGYFVPVYESEPHYSSNTSQPYIESPVQISPPPKFSRSTGITTPRAEVSTPARRIVVIRNTRHPQVDSAPVDLTQFGRSNSLENTPRLVDGQKSVYLIRRPINHSERSRSEEDYETYREQSPPVSPSENLRTPTPSEEIIISPDTVQSSTSPPSHSSRRHASYLRRPRPKPRTPSPRRTGPVRRPLPPPRPRPPPKHRSPPPEPPPKQDERKETEGKRGFFSFFSKKSNTKPITPSPPPEVVVEDEEYVADSHPKRVAKSVQRQKSAKSVVFINPDDQTIAIVENSHSKGDPLRPVVVRPKSVIKTRHEDHIVLPKSIIKTRHEDHINDDSTESLVKRSRSHTCLTCLSRYICLIIIICVILLIIGLAGVGVSAYFLKSSSASTVPKIVGAAIGGVIAIGALCFLCIVLGCLASRDGYFTYSDDSPNSGGRALAMISSSHPNAHLYTPYDYRKVSEKAHSSVKHPARTSSSKTPRSQSSATTSRTQRLNSSINKPDNPNNLTIEMPERLLTGGNLSPRSRERTLNQVVQNISHVVDDAKKRYNGDLSNRVIVKVDEHAKPAT